MAQQYLVLQRSRRHEFLGLDGRAAAPLAAVLLLALAGCNGTAVVTLTSTASPNTFLAYRVGLVSIQLQTSNGVTASNIQALRSKTTVDLARLVDLSEVLGVPSAAQGMFTQALVTLDYSAAQIVYDDGSTNGLALTPVSPSGQALRQVTLTLVLDPGNQVAVTRGGFPRLSLDFKMAASNLVNVAQKTVTVTPFMSASASPIDAKTVRVRGPFADVNAANTAITSGIVPFDFPTAGPGQITITPTATTSYEINGTPSAGSAGLAQLASLSSGTMIAAFGTLNSNASSNGFTNSLSSSAVSFSATEVLAGSSVQGSGFDRLSGIVSGRSGNTLTVEDGTLLSNGGTNTFIPGTADINVGANTQVTRDGPGRDPNLRHAATIRRFAHLRLRHGEHAGIGQRHRRCERGACAARANERLRDRDRAGRRGVDPQFGILGWPLARRLRFHRHRNRPGQRRERDRLSDKHRLFGLDVIRSWAHPSKSPAWSRHSARHRRISTPRRCSM